MVNIFTTQYLSYLKTSLTINTTYNLAKIKEMILLSLHLSSIETKQPVMEICRLHSIISGRESNIN